LFFRKEVLVKKILFVLVVLFMVAGLATAVGLVWGYNYVSRDLPRLDRVDDYRPPLVSQVVNTDGTLVAEFYDQRRYPMSIDSLPRYVKDAFVAAEDSNFYVHPGIDLMSIARAFIKNLTEGEVRQGGSTITQQVVKNLLLTPEKSLNRKIKEAILSYKIENRLSKDEILEIYLNQIFFGAGAYGLQSATNTYFRKDVQDLTLAEAALLAGLPPAPSAYSPVRNFELAKRRQSYVLEQMVTAGFISPSIARSAGEEELVIHNAPRQNIYAAPYYVTEVRRQLLENFRQLDPDRDGLKITIAVDLRASEFARLALRQGIEEVDRRLGWRGPLERLGRSGFDTYVDKYSVPSDPGEFDVPAMIMEKRGAKKFLLQLGKDTIEIDLSDSGWAKTLIEEGRRRAIVLENFLSPGDVIQVRATRTAEGVWQEPRLSQTPELEGAIGISEVNTGRVIATQGGYDYARSQFNRVTQALRQPGSAFKPIVYLAAIDGSGFSPSTIVDDSPRAFRVGDDIWEPGNFDSKFKGNVTLRNALEQSRNLASADIIAKIGVSSVINYSRALGIQSPLQPNLSLALGSNEVKPLELLGAYATIANNGLYIPPTFIETIEDRDGKLLYSAAHEKLKGIAQAVKPSSAFVLVNMMRGVVQSGTGWRVRELGRPVGGKTGTSNDFMDAWFAGMTPNYAAVVWVGYDVKRRIGDKETGGRIAAPIFLNALKPFLDEIDKEEFEQMNRIAQTEAQTLGLEFQEPTLPVPADFRPPDEGVIGAWVNKESGLPALEGEPGSFFEFFVAGTEPTAISASENSRSYLESPDL
jgi:penicillin-binding protein 1A